MAAPPRPAPRPRGPSVSADGVQVSQLTEEKARVVRPHTAPFPVPRPRRRTASLKIKTESKPLADDEDIYTDNSPVTNQITNIPPLACQMKPRKVAWADQADSKLETEPLSSMGFGLIPTPTSSVGGDLASTGLPPTQELSQRELTLNRKEAELNRLAERLDAQRSDQEFAMRERERDVQMREDNAHMREKDIKRQEFDLLNSEPLDGSSGRQSADLLSKEMALDDRTRALDHRDRELQELSQHLKNWEAKLKERELKISRREAELNSAPQQGYHYTQPQYPPQPFQQQIFPPQGGSYYPPQSYTPPPGQQSYAQSPQQQYAPRPPPSVIPTLPPPIAMPLAVNPAPLATVHPPPLSGRVARVSVDEEVATMLQRDLTIGSSQIDEDAEMARRLQEEDDREQRRKVEMDTQLAMVMQGKELGTEDMIAQGAGEGKALEELQRKLEKELAHKREMEEHDRQLATDLAKELAEAQPMPTRNDLDS